MPYSVPENKLLYEYQQMFYPTALMWRRVRVGALPQGREEAVYGVLRRFVDGVVSTGKAVILIEAKIEPSAEAVGQLMQYRELFPETPEFSQLKDLPIFCKLITVEEQETIRKVAEASNIEYVVFAPEWAVEELKRRRMKYVEYQTK